MPIEPLKHAEVTAFKERNDIINKTNEIIDYINETPFIEVDDAMSDTSENAVQNKVIKSYVDILENNGKQYTDHEILGVETEIGELGQNKQNKLTLGAGITIDNDVITLTGISVVIDNEMSDTSPNPVQNKVIKNYVDGKVTSISASDISSIYNVLTTVNGKPGYIKVNFTSDDNDYVIEGMGSIGKVIGTGMTFTIGLTSLKGGIHVCKFTQTLIFIIGVLEDGTTIDNSFTIDNANMVGWYFV